MKINYTNDVWDNIPKGPIEMKDVLSSIQFPKKQIESKILQARMFGKGSKKFDSIKSSLPCLFFNFNISGGVKLENALESTGVMYLDIDNIKEESIEQIKKDLIEKIPFLFAMWESTSKKGLSILIKVDGVQVNNFGEFAEYIKKTFSSFSWDKNCFNPTRKTFISMDESIYINNNCDVLSYERVSSTVILSTLPTIYSNISNRLDIGITVDDTPSITVDDTLPLPKKHYIRYNNKKDFATESAIEVYKDGVDVVEIQLNIKYKNGNRNQGLFTDGVKFLFLNPHVDNINDFTFHMHNLNKKKCLPLLDVKEVSILAKKVFKNKGEYNPVVRKKKYIVNRDIIISPKEAQSAVAKLINADKRESTLNFLKSLYSEGMTQKQLMKESDMGIATIKRYWKEIV
jgi:hypothetical protein